MSEQIKTFPSLDIPNDLFFTGTDSEIEEAEAKEAERANAIREIIFSPDFIAAEYTTEKGAREILHHSTRPGVLFQLSYIASDGIPTMHENYVSLGADPYSVGSVESANDLLKHFVDHGIDRPLVLRVLTSEI